MTVPIRSSSRPTSGLSVNRNVPPSTASCDLPRFEPGGARRGRQPLNPGDEFRAEELAERVAGEIARRAGRRGVANARFACVIRSWPSQTTTRSASELNVLSSSRRERSTSSSSKTFSMAVDSCRATSSSRSSRSISSPVRRETPERQRRRARGGRRGAGRGSSGSIADRAIDLARAPAHRGRHGHGGIVGCGSARRGELARIGRGHQVQDPGAAIVQPDATRFGREEAAPRARRRFRGSHAGAATRKPRG